MKESSEDPERAQLQFNYEVGELSRLRHRCIIEILCYSNDDPKACCLVYPFMKNGTLQRWEKKGHYTG